jgi:hypothetical protein
MQANSKYQGTVLATSLIFVLLGCGGGASNGGGGNSGGSKQEGWIWDAPTQSGHIEPSSLFHDHFSKCLMPAFVPSGESDFTVLSERKGDG